MITRFRVEGRYNDKEELVEELSSAAAKIIGALGQEGEWECTDDVAARVKTNDERRYNGYDGRMVFKFHPKVSEPPPWVEPGNMMPTSRHPL